MSKMYSDCCNAEIIDEESSICGKCYMSCTPMTNKLPTKLYAVKVPYTVYSRGDDI